jgi:hypothetical protein
VAIAVLRLVDDVRGLQPVTKLVVEAAAAAALYVTGSGAASSDRRPDLPFTIAWGS